MPKKAKSKKARASARKPSRAPIKGKSTRKATKAPRRTKRLKSLSRRATKLGKAPKPVPPVRKEFEMVPSGFLVKTEQGWVPLMMRREKAVPK